MNTKAAFALLELLIVLAIIGILASIIVPNFQNRQPRYQREEFITRLNALVRFAWQQAITTHSPHKISVNFDKKTFTVERETNERTPKGEQLFKQVTGQFMPTTLSIPNHIAIKQFIIEGFDEMKRSTSGQTKEIWFFVIPDGLTQTVTINALDNRDTVRGKARPWSLVLNPFTAQFTEYDTFQK